MHDGSLLCTLGACEQLVQLLSSIAHVEGGVVIHRTKPLVLPYYGVLPVVTFGPSPKRLLSG